MPATPGEVHAFPRHEREMPHDHDTERALLGALLIEPALVREVESLHASDFHLAKHATIFGAVLATEEATGKSDPLAVREELLRRGQLEEVGDVGYLFDLTESAVILGGLGFYADLLRAKTRQRKAIEVAATIVERGMHGDVGDLTAAAQQLQDLGEERQTHYRWRMRDSSDVANDPPIEWITEGIEPRCGLLVDGGEPSSGKSAVALDRAKRKACGMSWFGRVTKPSSTVWLAYEGSHSLGCRIRAWHAVHPEAHRIGEHYVSVVDGGPDLVSPAALRELVEIVDQAKEQHGRAPDTIVIDTFNMAAGAIDENDAGAVGQVLRMLAILRTRCSVSVELIHHTKKPQPGTPSQSQGMHALRGSSAIAGAADVVLLAIVSEKGRTLRVVKSRDGELGQALHYEIRGQDTGMALENGRPEFGPVVLPAAAPAEKQDAADTSHELAAAANARRAAVVATVVSMGGTATSARSIVDRTPGRDTQLYAAIREAVAAAELLPDGSGFRVPAAAAPDRCPPPLPPKGGGSAAAGSTPDSGGAARQQLGSTGQQGSRRARPDVPERKDLE